MGSNSFITDVSWSAPTRLPTGHRVRWGPVCSDDVVKSGSFFILGAGGGLTLLGLGGVEHSL